MTSSGREAAGDPPPTYLLPQPVDPSLPGPPIGEAIPSQEESQLPSAEQMLQDAIPLEAPPDVSAPLSPFHEFFYRGSGWDDGHSWVMGNGDRMGIFTMVHSTQAEASIGSKEWAIPGASCDFRGAIHWISGPVTTDMPPRVYDVSLVFTRRERLTANLAVDASFNVGFYTDFEVSARQSVRFPSWLVFYYQRREDLQWLLGIDILDRRDIFCLPVAGFVFTPTDYLRLEAVFPTPRIACRTFNNRWAYVTAETGGGTWAIARQSGASDIVNYRDFRLLVGLTEKGANSGHEAFEAGFAFDRQLDYRSGIGDFQPKATAVIQFVAMH